MKGLIQKHRNIARAMQDPNDLNTFGHSAVKNNVMANWKTAEFRGQVRTFSAQFWRSGQQLAFFVDRIKPMISGSGVVFSNMGSDFNKVEMSSTGSQYDRHQLPFLFRRLRTVSLIPCISSGARSPRSASSIPTAISRRNSSRRKRCTSLDSPSQRYNSHRSCDESCSVADFTSATVLTLER
jgi:hypothetical protein